MSAESWLNGVDPADRHHISESAAKLASLISGGQTPPSIQELADIFIDPDTGDDGEIAPKEQIEALSHLFVTALVLLAEEKAGAPGHQMEVHVLMKNDEAEDHVEITVSGYSDPRFAVAALARLEDQGYLDQLWNVAINGEPDPDGPEVFIKNNDAAEESA